MSTIKNERTFQMPSRGAYGMSSLEMYETWWARRPERVTIRLADLDAGDRFVTLTSRVGELVETQVALEALRGGFESLWQKGGPDVQVRFEDGGLAMVRGGLMVVKLRSARE